MGDESRDSLAPEEIRSALFHFLSYRPRTRKEAVSKFRKIGGPIEALDFYLREFEELGLIDDRKFAMDFVDVRLRSKKHGRIRIRQELLKKGVDKQWIEESISSLVTRELEIEAAQKSIPMRWQRKGNSLTKNDLSKLKAALLRRGFDFETVRAAIDSYDWDLGD